jgi:HD-GYP domain-containing protein (c-di-GMP phosphodiesterase class II)
MVAVQTTDLIEKGAGEAFLQLAKTTDKFERYENPHALRLAVIADELAQEFHLARHDRGSLYAAALLHDLGEVAMERDYIQATGPLSQEERLDLSRHPVIGEREASRAGADRAAQLLVRWHHEWWNGTGYPDALRREEIPLAAKEAARRELMDRAGIEFDPAVVHLFLKLDGIPELESYAKLATDAPVEETVVSKSGGWDLFSSFTK